MKNLGYSVVLTQGARALSSGTSTLSSGANTLSTGANTLADGMKEFDNSGINAIYNLVNGDIKGAQDRIEKLLDLANKDENSSSYKYILKVDSLKK